jgi:hypothetical protein
MKVRLSAFHPTFRQAIAMVLVGMLLLGASLVFGVFGSTYEVKGPYDQLYPVESGAIIPR